MNDFNLLILTEGSLLTLFEFMKLTGIERDFTNAFKKYVTEQALLIFNKSTDSHTKIEELIDFKLACDQLSVLLSTDALKLPQKIAFEAFVNSSTI